RAAGSRAAPAGGQAAFFCKLPSFLPYNSMAPPHPSGGLCAALPDAVLPYLPACDAGEMFSFLVSLNKTMQLCVLLQLLCGNFFLLTLEIHSSPTASSLRFCTLPSI
uniref:hypothetical protein n=1 Tax=Gemmiger qucibialis TaxID=2997294 RepID=UPI004028D8C6